MGPWLEEGEAWAVHLVLELPRVSRSDYALRLRGLAPLERTAEAGGRQWWWRGLLLPG